MIFADSRYAAENVVVETVADRDGDPVKVIRPPTWYGQNFAARRHTLTEGERLEQLAQRFYRDPAMWWIIAIANPEILYPDQIPGGTEIRIPLAAALR